MPEEQNMDRLETPVDGSELFAGADWDFETLKRTYDAIEDIALNELGLDVYVNQIEVITAEQMLDAYSSVGMPLMYRHWSFGKHFAQNDVLYRKGLRGLAFEIVINSDPCITYIMEENTMPLQALVIAHASFGHNHFFKNNATFRQWTDAESILDYLAFAKRYIAQCEERHGVEAVERVVDAAHSLMNQGVDRMGRRERPNLKREEERIKERLTHDEENYNDLWRTLPAYAQQREEEAESERMSSRERDRRGMGLPEENILYFLEKHAPLLKGWEREILRIVRVVARYFYPQRQTKVMNEGCATWVHYTIMTRLHEKGLIDDGAFLEFLHSHSGVLFQPAFDDPRFSGLNPYTFGFNIMRDIERICNEPTAEDHEWFPHIAGNGDSLGTLKSAWAEHRDESFILQFLSPHLIREMRLFEIDDDQSKSEILIEAIHDERGYRQVRRALAAQHDPAYLDPPIEIIDADLKGSRVLLLRHTVRDGIRLEAQETRRVLRNLAMLWGYDVRLEERDPESDELVAEHSQAAP